MFKVREYDPCLKNIYSIISLSPQSGGDGVCLTVSGSPLTLSCSITQPSSVTTPTTLMSNWTAPNSDYDRVNAVNDTSVELVISSVETADSGDYICSATLTDSSSSSYIVDSQPANDTLSVTVSKCQFRSA